MTLLHARSWAALAIALAASTALRAADAPQKPLLPKPAEIKTLSVHPAKVSLHIQQRLDHVPKALQDLGWKAQVRLCKRFRRLVARGKHPNVTVTAVARELIAFMWAIAKEVPLAA